MTKKERFVQFLIFFIGLIIMAFGIALMIKANIGVASWDVLHIGLYKQLGLTIGTWNIIVGFIILFISSIIMKKLPQPGAYINMLLVGVFIDLFLLIPIHSSWISMKLFILLIGILIYAIGMGIYISAGFGTGPRDSLMMALHLRKGWKIQNVRLVMEVSVVFIGWMLGGPVHMGTIIISLLIGHVSGVTIPYFYKRTKKIMEMIRQKKVKKKSMAI